MKRPLVKMYESYFFQSKCSTQKKDSFDNRVKLTW
jgi:hypothetical protein